MVHTTQLLSERYELARIIGRGGMSDVYEAVDLVNGAKVAVKVVRSADPELARRLAQEVRTLKRVQHPGLVRLLDSGLEDGQAYLVMTLVEGPTLADMLHGDALGATRTATLGAELSDALAHVHASGIVHRDLKPSNILLDNGRGGAAMLGDFGIARLLDTQTLTLDGTTLGTVAYMAPEQLEDHHVGPSADMWSLGIVLLECLQGQRVYSGTTGEIISRRSGQPVPLPADLPVPWKLVLSGLLDHRPEQRLTAAEAASLLRSPALSAASDTVTVVSRDSAAATAQMLPTVPHDLTALAAGAVPLLGAVSGAGERSGATALMEEVQRETTRVQPLGSRPRRRWGSRSMRIAEALALLALVTAVMVILLQGPGSTGQTKLPPRHSSTVAHLGRSTTTSTASVPSGPDALAALVRDVATGEESSALDTATGQTILQHAQQALSQVTSGNAATAAGELQQAASTLAAGVQSGSISSAEGDTLRADLSTLATALGLGAAATVPTTPAPGPKPGHGHGGSGGGGNGGGD